MSLLAALVAFAANADSVAEPPMTTINGHQYHYYEVKPNETVFSISKRLGISREEIIECNPSAADVLQAYSRLYFPVKASASAAGKADSQNAVTHLVQPKETIYGISKTYGVTTDQIIKLNPSARDGIKPGQTLIINPGKAAQEVKPVENPAVTGPNPAARNETAASGTHTIAQGETLYRIATANGITVDDLITANPSLDPINYQAGTVIKIPATKTPATSERPLMPGASASTPASTQTTAATTATAPVQPAVPAAETAGNLASEIIQDARNVDTPALTFTPIAKPADQEYDIAVILPLMLKEARPSRSAEMFTDFYRGFLLGAKSLSADGPRINIRAYDTANSADTVRALMALPEIKGAHIIVGPENDEQFEIVARAANGSDAFVVNVFDTRNDRQVQQSNIIQTNIPRDVMYDRAVDAFLKEYKGVKPVFLSRVNSTPDKEEFVNLLRERLREQGIPFTDIAFRDVLNDTDLYGLRRDSAYVFVPMSSHQNEFIKIAPAIKKFRESNYYSRYTGVFGYPEWLKFRGDIADNLAEVNATIYSRFYRNDNDADTRRVGDEFTAVYGHPMIVSEPSTAILGYDVARFIINSLRHNGADFHNGTLNYQGIQTGFFLNNENIEGLENDSLLLIRFREGQAPECTRI